MKRPGVLSWAIFCLCIVGIILSGISLKTHYSKSASEFCDVDTTFNCDLVNRGPWADIHGFPVAAIGLIGYALLLVLSRFVPWYKGTAAVLMVGALAGLAYSLHLTYLEAYVIGAWCIVCLGSQATIAVIAVLSIAAFAFTFRAARRTDEIAAT